MLTPGKTTFFQIVELDNSRFVMIYVLAYFIYHDKMGASDMVKKELLDRTTRQFMSAQVMTLCQLEALLSCSQRSVQRYLAKWDALRSYNYNGMYFTLPVIARFDSFGVWKYQDVGFSRFGNLKDTVVQLVSNSSAGLTATELGQILGVNAHSFMSQFRVDPRLKRDKWEGRLVYFCAEQDIGSAQQRKRFAGKSVSPPFPSDAQAVVILVSVLKNPEATIEQLVKIMNKEHRGISVTMVERLLEHHGLEKKTGLHTL